MRLQNFIINENDKELEKFIDNIKKECKPALKLYSKVNQPLFRGISSSEYFGKLKVRKNRKSLDTPLKAHKYLDELFKKYHGWKVRSEGLFCVGDPEPTTRYGNNVIVFPIGNFKYIWSYRVDDLYKSLYSFSNFAYGGEYFSLGDIAILENADEFKSYLNRRISPPNLLDLLNNADEIIKLAKKSLEDLIKSYSNKNIVNYFSSFRRHEIALKCNSYYYIGEQYFYEAETELGLPHEI